MIKRLHKRKFMSILLSCMMVFSMLAGTGITQVKAHDYQEGDQVDWKDLQPGDTVRRGVTLKEDRYVVVCETCRKVWFADSDIDADSMTVQLAGREEHKNHADNVNYSLFSTYFTYGAAGYYAVYTIAGDENFGYIITYNTNGGSDISAGKAYRLPDPLPTPTKDGKDFAGWFLDEELSHPARENASIYADTTLYAKWTEHKHTFSDEWSSDDKEHWHAATCNDTTDRDSVASHTYSSKNEAQYYICNICGYINKTRQDDLETANEVIKKIDAIGEVEYTPECNERIKTAETGFNGLSDAQQLLVTNRQKLSAALLKYSELMKKANEDADKKDDTNKDNPANKPDTGNNQNPANKPDTGNDQNPVNKPDTGNNSSTIQQPTTSNKADVTTKQNTSQTPFAKGFKITQTKKSIKISWNKVKGADGYLVYTAYCTNKFTKATKQTKTSITITKLDGKKLNTKKNVKVYVKAYKLVNGKKVIIGKSITAHIVGLKNKDNTNAKAIKLTSKSKVTLAKGKTSQIKAKTVLKDSTKKEFPEKHAAKFRYVSSNKKVATVNKKGKIKAKAKGSCSIYVYAKNGIAKEVKVIVNN